MQCRCRNEVSETLKYTVHTVLKSVHHLQIQNQQAFFNQLYIKSYRQIYATKEISRDMAILTVTIAALLVMTSAESIERRRPFHRRGSTTTTSYPLTIDNEGSESNFKLRGKDPFSAKDSTPVTKIIGDSSSGNFKLEGNKLTSFSEYTFGSSKQTYSGPDGNISDGSISDEDKNFSSFKNHKKISLLPTTNASSKDRKPNSGAFDFLNGDFVKPKVTAGKAHMLEATSIAAQVGKTKTSSAISSKFSISHPSPSSNKASVKLAHLDDSAVYEVYASLDHSSGKTKFGTSPTSSATTGSYSFEGNIKKVPLKYEEGVTGGVAGNGRQKSKLSTDTFGSGSLVSASNFHSSLGSFDSDNYSTGKKQQQSISNSPINKYNFAEPPSLVKSTLNTLKHFGAGLIGNDKGAVRVRYDLENKDNYKIGSNFGKGRYETDENYENSEEPAHSKGKFSGSAGSVSVGAVELRSKFASDFDVKNIKLVNDGVGFSNIGHTLSGSLKNHISPHYKHSQSILNMQHHQQKQTHHQSAQSLAQLHTNTLGNTGSLDNPKPLDFRPKFKLQDVPNLYPADHLGAGIEAKGQIENLLNAEHAPKDESLVTQLLGDGSPTSRPHYHHFLKSQEDNKLEKEALRQQIEFLKAQAAKRPVDHSNFNQPAIVSNAQKFRPLHRIPSHVRLGVKAPYPLPRIPHYNDRPYSISFKI
ncbi:uncharacterized protein LOC133391045 isoform X3 [Anopheles gambiae]|uniref:uncharacterized protein LOC133391045 isoform X3 n=1 Tax=Anopheles gambiae TaxID=7165 RepID=UPI002AC9D304|nr:uncharacterized protein LOC133391045 isoform X3 [Anopheles gambiae]